MELEKNVESDEFMPEVYQQFLCYQKKVNKRFQEMEGMLGLAAQQLEKLKVRKAKRKNTKFDNPIVKSKVESSKEVEPEPLHHLKLRFPKFEGAEVFECSQDYEHQLVGCGIGNMAKEWPNHTKEPHNRQQKREVFKNLAHAASETYTGKPIYDERPVYDEPGEGQDCWPEHEFILAALRGDNSNSPHLLQSELCTSEGLEADLKNKPNKVLNDGDKPKLVDYKDEERQGGVEEKSSIILMKRREELIEDVLCADSPTAANSSGLEKKSNHLNKNMIIFDPGGLVQDHSEGINMMFKNMSSIEEVKLDKVALINSACGQPGQWQGHPKFVVQIEISDGIQGRQGEPGEMIKKMNKNSDSTSIKTDKPAIVGKLANLQSAPGSSVKQVELIELTPKKLECRLKEGFCPYCEDKEGIMHHCVLPCQFVIRQEEESGREEGNIKEITSSDNKNEVPTVETMEVSVHAIKGFHSNKTITLTGRRGKQQFEILIDGGSTHSFIDENIASKLKGELVRTHPMKVQVANGNHLESKYECKDFRWKIGNHEFQTSVRTLSMGGYDLVLGVDETPHFLELNDLSRPLICPFEAGQIEQIQVKEQYPADEKITSRNPNTMREKAEDSLYKTITEDPFIATISYRFGKMSSNFGKENVLIFDPGGQVQNKQSIGIKSKFKDLFRSEVKLEIVMSISVGEQLRPWKDLSLIIQAMEQLLKGPSRWQRKMVNIEIVNSAIPQGQSFQEVSDQFVNIVDEINQQNVYSVVTGSLDNAMRLEDNDVSRKRALITVFDPGGYIICDCNVQLGGTTRI